MTTRDDLDRIEGVCREPMPLRADGEGLGDVAAAVFGVQWNALGSVE